MKSVLFAASAATLALVPAVASAADSDGFYAGVQGGYHDIDGGLDGAIFGGFLGYNVPAGNNLVVGVEGNANLGTGDIDAEYGASVHVGGKFGANNMLFARAGYQEVEFGVAGFDVSDGDYLLGVGADFGMGAKSSLRVVVDTIAFDSLRLTAGWSFNF